MNQGLNDLCADTALHDKPRPPTALEAHAKDLASAINALELNNAKLQKVLVRAVGPQPEKPPQEGLKSITVASATFPNINGRTNQIRGLIDAQMNMIAALEALI